MKIIRGFLILILSLLSVAAWAEALNINTATADQLAATMTGVGKAKAEAIIKDRETHGLFKSVDDLDRVKGIGKSTVDKNRDKLAVGGELAPVKPAAAQPEQKH